MRPARAGFSIGLFLFAFVLFLAACGLGAYGFMTAGSAFMGLLESGTQGGLPGSIPFTVEEPGPYQVWAADSADDGAMAAGFQAMVLDNAQVYGPNGNAVGLEEPAGSAEMTVNGERWELVRVFETTVVGEHRIETTAGSFIDTSNLAVSVKPGGDGMDFAMGTVYLIAGGVCLFFAFIIGLVSLFVGGGRRKPANED